MKLLDGNADALTNTYIACIGPVTAKTAQQYGLSVDLIPGERTLQGVIDSIEMFVKYK